MFVNITEVNKAEYQVIYADPPWRYADNGCNGACENHYNTMSIKEICALPIKDIAAKDSILFLWATYPMLPEAIALMEAWGFRYKTIAFQWIKLNRSGKGYYFGLGRWTRGNTEPCLIGVRGKPHKFVQSKSVRQIIEYPLTRHSAKPPIARDKIVELMGDIPRIELFARESAAGWDCWGNEAPDETAPPLSDETEIEEQEGQLSLF